MNSTKLGKCEWCTRPATQITGWGDWHLCHGHALLAWANRDTWEATDMKQAALDYHAALLDIKTWFKENPEA